MAASFSACRFLWLGRPSSLKYDPVLLRRVGTDAVGVQTEVVRGAAPASPGEERRSRTLDSLLVQRREQAERSVLISCPSITSENRFLRQVSVHGDVQNCFFYESYGSYAVVEFARRDGVASLLQAAAIPCVSRESMVPFKSRLLSLRNLDGANVNQQSGVQFQPQVPVYINQLIQKVSVEESVDQQMTALTEAYQLTEENSRLRFLVCSLLKDIAAAYFPECNIKPFGSSVNGFGKLGCDLDMFLDLDGVAGRSVKTPTSGLFLEYQMKRASTERAVTQSILSVIGECVDQFGAGCVGVQKILNARCPLVRFAHQPSGFQCDLTANNRVAMKSTELLYLYGKLDPRVRSLVFTVRCWARTQGVTSSIPGAWITNFSLTVMVLFFLQKRSPPIIPTLDHLRELAGPADQSVIEGNDCTFVRDSSRIQPQQNTETLEKLLFEFFEFYGSFPFSKMSLNIRKGKEQNKQEVTPLHIQNPFETSLNVSKNVNATQLDRFVALCQESSWQLQQTKTSRPRASAPDGVLRPWGLAVLLLPLQVAAIKGRKKKRREMASERIKGLLESLKNKKESKT